ncbi:MAG: lytic murein transglycosylase [Desulfobacterales bacterium]|uniref:Lytic murein transglycosylase n=1 Tax=Candidatus Desulfatibia profunda TaxID=2841695 RepID=A0A8J6TGJ1_9BACT|nr:lytic murein transglycosylase [Candidatus Desulfatibia profunda]MBL7181053.1 lytic murein transglycosylase [Desulfobacterales bacterium]
MKIRLRYLAFFVCLIILISILRAQVSSSAETKGSYFKTLQQTLIKDGFDQAWINSLYSKPEVYFETEGVSRFLVHREATLNYDQFASPDSIQRARQYMQTYKSILENTEQSYGVDKEIITAIILIESQFGTLMQGPSTLNILSTMASLANPNIRNMLWKEATRSRKLSRKRYEKWAQRKSKWAYIELKAFLKYTAKEDIDPSAVYGSYAGAVGIAQFMPSNILAYAKDGDNDGKVDLFTHADAIASIANYLKYYGWNADINRAKAEKVIFRYNRSTYYVDAVLKISDLLNPNKAKVGDTPDPLITGLSLH